jgi:nitroimidazol reductase NimA-like FMN-containing flavoprotein (pyridoxamine 5'-phosphate oxidase superfamily)
MRRKDKEIQARAEIVEIIEKAPVCRLGLCRDNVPYVVPLNFGYRDGCLYLHCAKEGRKMDMIRANPRVCFEIDTDVEVIRAEQPCDWGMKFASVIGFGTASVPEDLEEKKRGLDAIMEHYSSRPPQPYAESYLKHTAVIRIEVEEMTGKRSGSSIRSIVRQHS